MAYINFKNQNMSYKRKGKQRGRDPRVREDRFSESIDKDVYNANFDKIDWSDGKGKQ